MCWDQKNRVMSQGLPRRAPVKKGTVTWGGSLGQKRRFSVKFQCKLLHSWLRWIFWSLFSKNQLFSSLKIRCFFKKSQLWTQNVDANSCTREFLFYSIRAKMHFWDTFLRNIFKACIFWTSQRKTVLSTPKDTLSHTFAPHWTPSWGSTYLIFENFFGKFHKSS